MWRAYKSGGLWAWLTLTGLGAACSESPKPPPPMPTAGSASQGLGGTLSLGGSSTAGFTLSQCAGPLPSAPLKRWSLVDLDHTLDMLFGPGTGLAGVVNDRGYERDLSYVFVEALRNEAVTRAHSVVASSDVFRVCDDADDAAPDCIAPWLKSWGEKLYRRPLTREQTDAYVVQFRSALARLSPAEAAQNALISMMLSPYFALRIELGDGRTGQLTPYELAARLSHFATRRAPDSELRARAASDELADPAVLLSELHRLWATPEGQSARALQHLAWLGVDADYLPPALAPELRAAMLEQASALIGDVFTNQNGTLLELLTSRPQPPSPLLAEHYGSAGPLANNPPEVSPLFAGILSESLFLTTFGRPSSRGRALLEGLLCLSIPDHPAQADATLAPGRTPRERLGQSIAGNPACIACHNLIDPTGFALEAFDDQGRLTGFDSSGSVPVSVGSEQKSVAAPRELGTAIATSGLGLTCAARHYLEYVLDRKIPNPDDAAINRNSGPPPAPIIRENREQEWVKCLLRDAPNPNVFDLEKAAEELVTSRVFSRLALLPAFVVAFDTSVDPVEHALQETSQFRGAFADPLDQTTLDAYAAALRRVRELDDMANVPEPDGAGAGGAAGSGGESASGGGEAAAGAP